MSRTTPGFTYDPNLGDPRATYRRADAVYPESSQPELPGVFVADVTGETVISTMTGRQRLTWEAHPGTPCIILGYWSDGTVHLRWAAINDSYRIDGRFPGWVVERDPTAVMAGGGRILPANTLPELARGFPTGRVLAIVASVLLVLGLIVLLAILATVGR